MDEKKSGKKLDAFFEKMGIVEAVSEFAEMHIRNYMIQGEAAQGLEEMLHRAPTDLLDLIWEGVFGESPKEIERGEKEKALFHSIPEMLDEELVYTDMWNVKLLVGMAAQAEIPMELLAKVYERFMPRGWVFFFVTEKGCMGVVPDEVKEVLKKLDEPETKEEFSAISMYRWGVELCLKLYGVFTEKELMRMLEHMLQTDMEKLRETESTHRTLHELLDVFEQQELFWREEDYFISPYLESRSDYRKLLQKQRNKEYYLPDGQQVETLLLKTGIVESKEYKAVLECLTRELKDVELAGKMLLEIADGVCQADWEIPMIMNLLYSWGVAFDSVRTSERFLSVLAEWTYTVWRWSECGYSRKEKKLVNEDLKYLNFEKSTPINSEKSERKVYPNAPCPCGSGKKYKNCCRGK